jgi:hypothetical protein
MSLLLPSLLLPFAAAHMLPLRPLSLLLLLLLLLLEYICQRFPITAAVVLMRTQHYLITKGLAHCRLQ